MSKYPTQCMRGASKSPISRIYLLFGQVPRQLYSFLWVFSIGALGETYTTLKASPMSACESGSSSYTFNPHTHACINAHIHS